MEKNSDRVQFRYDLRERETRELMTDRIQYIFLELPNCRRALTPEASILDNFCYALHNMERLPEKPLGFDSELLQLLFDSAVIANFTPQERTKYDLDMRTERDFKNQLFYAREEGKKEGREEGRKEGREEGREEALKDLSKRLLAKGMTLEEVQSILSDI